MHTHSPAMAPLPRARPMASISSMKMMLGAWLRACENRSLTRAGPTPTNISMKSEPDMLRKGTPASPAVALASSVFPAAQPLIPCKQGRQRARHSEVHRGSSRTSYSLHAQMACARPWRMPRTRGKDRRGPELQELHACSTNAALGNSTVHAALLLSCAVLYQIVL